MHAANVASGDRGDYAEFGIGTVYVPQDLAMSGFVYCSQPTVKTEREETCACKAVEGAGTSTIHHRGA